MKNIIEKNRSLVIIVGVLFILLIGVSFAYFQSQIGAAQQTDVKVLSKTVDRLTFKTGDTINMNVGFGNFTNGKGSAVSNKTYAQATLTANNDTNEATMSYYLYLAIRNNDFIYTQDTNTPELLLHITDKNNEEVNSIEGLEYKSVVDGNGITQTGFDVTTKTGILTLLNKKEITAAPLTTEEWNIELIFVNHNFDQTANAGKTFYAKVIIQSDEYQGPVYASDVCNEGDSISNCLMDLAFGSETSGLYHHSVNLANSAGDNSYRYSGANPNNYICLSNDDVCAESDLFRILQIIPDVSISQNEEFELANFIKVVGSSDFDSYNSCRGFATIYNDSYEYIGIISSDVLNNPVSDLNIPGTLFGEISDTDNYSHRELLSLTDYAYTASPSAWGKKLSEYNDTNVVNNNWLYIGKKEYLLNIVKFGEGVEVYVINEDGSVTTGLSSDNDRKVLHLIDSLTGSIKSCSKDVSVAHYLSGDGTKENPIRIDLAYCVCK